jgi:DNA helicase-2/ATP-dependent DNA helicase PcrA
MDSLKTSLLDQVWLRLSKDEKLLRLSVEQLQFILHPFAESSFLSACPGSGKTEVVGYKAAYEIAGWKKWNAGIAVLTFTNNAASEIKARAAMYSNGKSHFFPHFVGTFDSWLHGYLFQPFGFSVMGDEGCGKQCIDIIESESTAPFLSNYLSKLYRGREYQPAQVNHFCLSLDGKPCYIKGNRTFTPAEEKILVENKKRFSQAGFATYEDAERLSIRLLNDLPLRKLVVGRFPVIMVDECQDLSPTQLEIISLLQNAGTVFHFIGDLNQAIYEFRKVDPLLVKQHAVKYGMHELKLSANYRSVQRIVDVCSSIINTGAVNGRENDGEDCCKVWEYPLDDIARLPLLFEEYIVKRGSPVIRPPY